jgi:hypothetical protein
MESVEHFKLVRDSQSKTISQMTHYIQDNNDVIRHINARPQEASSCFTTTPASHKLHSC